MSTSSENGFSLRKLQFAVALLVAASPAGFALAEDTVPLHVAQKHVSTNGIATEIHRDTSRELNEGDLAQVALLCENLLHHVADARKALASDDQKTALADVAKGLDLLRIIHHILPRTKVQVDVKDKAGKLLYSHARYAQVNEIPLLQVFTTVDYLQPILEAKRKTVEPHGVKLLQSHLLQSKMTLNLSLTESQLKLAEKSLAASSTAPADAALSHIFSEAIVVTLDEYESPLGEIREALVYAHRAISHKQYEEARENLATAHDRLSVYRELLPESSQKEMDDLSAEIKGVEQEIAGSTAEGSTRAMEKLTRLFRKLTHPSLPVKRKPVEIPQSAVLPQTGR